MNSPAPTDSNVSNTAKTGFDGAGIRIGVFDSGLGGLSVLKALRQCIPGAALIYVADSGHAPYGEREGDFIVGRSQRICDFLLSQGVEVIVVACNTATAAAIHLLRGAHPQVAIIGVEPGLKPAVALSVNKRVGVLATPNTLASDKFKRLLHTHGGGAEVMAQACPGLAREIERGLLDSPALRALVTQFTEPLKQAGVDTVVLGCTHYPFVAPLFAEALGAHVRIIDTSEAVASHTARICSQRIRSDRVTSDAGGDASSAGAAPAIALWTSGEPHALSQAARNWLGIDAGVSLLP